MVQGETFNEQTKAGAPQILELLSELQARDKKSKGAVQSGSVAGAGLADPRGFSVVNATGHDVGKVEDLYVDPHTRQPYFALLSLGNHTLGIGNRKVLVAFDDLLLTGSKEAHVRATLS